MQRAPRGYAIPFVLMLLLLLAVAVSAYLGAVGSGSRATSSALKERQAFFAADDLCRITAVLAQNYLRTVATPTAAGLRAAVVDAGGGETLPKLSPPGFLTRGADGGPGFEVLSLGSAQTKVIPNGAFKDMMAVQRPLDLRVRVQQADGNAAATCRQKVFLASVSAFQFYIFSEPYLDWDPVPLMTVRGRVHGNEDICVAGASGPVNGLVGDRITAAGRILRASVADRVGPDRCRAAIGATANNVKFATDDTFAAFAPLEKDHLDADWRTWAETTFGGRVLDVAHGVQRLKLPVIGAPRVQAGHNLGVTKFGEVETNYRENNLASQRFVVDPVLRTEPGDVREQKLAFKADVRIVNGVWYLRDTAAPHLPGTPLWSDHPGRHTVAGTTADDIEQGQELFLPTVAVGQEDLRTARAWPTSPGRVTPRRFSYYGYDVAAQSGKGAMTRVAGDPPAVLSYGSVFRDPDDGVGGTTPYWYVGHWRNRSAGASSLCLGNTANTSADCPDEATIPGTHTPYTSDDQCLLRADVTPTVAGGCTTSMHTSLLNGTRSGFKDGWREVRSKPSSTTVLTLRAGDGTTLAPDPFGTGVTRNERDRSRILPINIDVAALQAALADCSTGELGSYFPGTCGAAGGGRTFNGIVYVTATWPGSLRGLGDTPASSGFPDEAPYQGRQTQPVTASAPQTVTADPPQPDPLLGVAGYNDDENGDGTPDRELQQNEALPYPLCSDDGTLSSDQRIFDKLQVSPSAAGRFTIPRCDAYGGSGGKIGAFPQAVRILNAAHVNPPTTLTTANGTLSLPSGLLPRGLTIATNLPMYVVGDVNVGTTPMLSPDVTPTNDHFVPLMLAGDRVTRHSNAWNDARARWGMPMAVFDRVGATTRQQFEVFTGWLQSDKANAFHDDGIENFMRYNEHWNQVDSFYFGAMVAGFASVYDTGGANGNGDGAARRHGFNAPKRIEGYDFHLDQIPNQPPGAPQYNIQGIFLWEAE
jgi:hypothetical protein